MRRGLALAGGALGLSAVLYGLADSGGRGHRIASAEFPLAIAIAPFTSAGRDSNERAIADGMTENLVNALATSHAPPFVTATVLLPPLLRLM